MTATFIHIGGKDWLGVLSSDFGTTNCHGATLEDVLREMSPRSSVEEVSATADFLRRVSRREKKMVANVF